MDDKGWQRYACYQMHEVVVDALATFFPHKKDTSLE